MARQAQLKFPALKDFTRTEHGGTLRKGKRKLARPVATKSPMHLVLRASRARGESSMLRLCFCNHIDALVVKHADKNEVRILRMANVGNHIHLTIQARTRKGFQCFLRSITGLIARLVTGAERGRASGPFWDSLAFSRVVKWGRDFAGVARYVLQNALETHGVPTTRKPDGWFRGVVLGGAAWPLGRRSLADEPGLEAMAPPSKYLT